MRASLGLDQDEMGSLLGVSREWVSKLENEKEDFSEFVLMKMEATGAKAKVTGSESTSRTNDAPQAGYSSSAAETDLRRSFDELIAAANGDPNRLGWIAEQMRAHLTPPAHWATPARPNPNLVTIRPKTEKGQQLPSSSTQARTA